MRNLHDLPTAHGVYVVHLFISHPRAFVVGRLGQEHFPAGHYFYVGSARGPGGLRARVDRHLRAVAEVRDVPYTVTDNPLECAWSQALAQLPGVFIPVPHFGSSDCRSGCGAHLVGLPRRADIDRVQCALAQITPTPIGSLRLR